MSMALRSPQTSETVTRTEPCQHADAGGQLCEADTLVTAVYYPRSYEGADADGNRGQWVPGYFDSPDLGRCPLGCVLTEAEEHAVLDRAAATFSDLLHGRD